MHDRNRFRFANSPAVTLFPRLDFSHKHTTGRYSPKFRHAYGFIASLTLLLTSAMASGQQPQIPRATNPPAFTNTPRQVREGSATLVQAYDPASKLRLAISVRAPKMADEEAFIKQLQDKTSPNFHKYLSPAQWNARFAPAVEDEQAVVDWANSQGLTVTARYPNRLMVNVEGTVDTIQKAFSIRINKYEVNGTTEFSNDRDPVIPSNLAGIVEYVDGLNSIMRMRPASSGMKGLRGPDYSPGPVHQMSPSNHRDATAPAPKEPFKSQQVDGAGQITGGFYDPTDFYSQQGYNYNGLQALGHCCNPFHTSGHDGGGPVETSIGLATDGDFADSDISGFYSHYPYLAGDYYHISVNGTAGCCSDESTLDTEWSIAMSNSFGSGYDTAQVYNYEAAQSFGDFGTVFQQMLNDNLVRVVNISYGLPEYWFEDNAPSLLTSWHGIFNQMIGQGWTIMAAAGDGGTVAGCDSRLAVLYPESDPDVVSVGGTDLQLNTDGSFGSEVAWTGDTFSGACSENDGGGGGGCSEVWSAPGYQVNPYCGSGSRSVPDVALHASIYPWANLFYNGSFGPGAAGTSLASPLMSGFIAQENAYSLSIGKSSVGEVNYDVYAEGGYNESAPHYPFYDITSGCTSNDDTGSTGAWCAAAGYDLATGWGSFNALQMAWAINWEDSLAYSAPSVVFSGPATNTWYNTDQAVGWTINANGNPLGIAGFTQGWDSIPADPFFDGNRNDSSSFFSGPQFANSTAGCLSLNGGLGCAGGVSQGCHIAHVRSWSNQGSTSGDVSYGPLCFDDINPALSAVNFPAANSNGYYNAAVKVTLTASDPGGSGASGIKTTYYAIDTTTCTSSNLGACTVYSGPITITATGTHYVSAFTRDVAGNFSAVVTDFVHIDEVAPVSSATLGGTHSGSVYSTAVQFTLSATDNYSGVASTHYAIDAAPSATYTGPFTISSFGSHTVKFYSIDKAGNTEATKSVSCSIAPLTTTTLVSSVNPSNLGQTVTFIATVVASDGPTPTGTVTFAQGGVTITTVALSGGKASVADGGLTGGSHSITATYNGSATDPASTGTLTQTVLAPATTTTLVSSVNPSTVGVPVTFTATVTPSSGATPTGTVTFAQGGVTITTVALSGGKASVGDGGLTVGSHPITATYNGNSADRASTSAALNQVVNASPTKTILASSANPSNLGQLVTFTATVTASTGATPTGTVTFAQGGVTIGTVTLSGGKASVGDSGLTSGSHSITAVYNGSSSDKTSTSASLNQVVNGSVTTTTLVSSKNPSTVGVPVTFTATVTPSGGATPTGTVTFAQGGVTITTVALIGGKASVGDGGLTVGSHSITAIYNGSSTDKASTSAALSQVVNASPTNTTLASSANPSTVGESVTFTATVTASTGPAPTGTVTFSQGSVLIGTVTLSGGKAALAYSGLTSGTHPITAVYKGSTTDVTSTSVALNQVVNP